MKIIAQSIHVRRGTYVSEGEKKTCRTHTEILIATGRDTCAIQKAVQYNGSKMH